MKIIFLTNNPISICLLNWLKSDVSNVVIELSSELTTDFLTEHNPDLIISYNYRYIIPEKILKLAENKMINLHISYLPWNKGAHPNLWSFLDNTPKGVSIHLIDKGIDTGKVLVQKELEFDETTETLETSYQKLHTEIQNLFIENWQDIKSFSISPKAQTSCGSYHNMQDFFSVYNIIGDQIWSLTISELKKVYSNRIKNKQ